MSTLDFSQLQVARENPDGPFAEPEARVPISPTLNRLVQGAHALLDRECEEVAAADPSVRDNAAMILSLQQIARVLGGEISGGQVMAPGPGHSKTDRSLSVKLSGGAPDGFIVHSFAGDNPLVCRDYVRQWLGLPAWQSNGRERQSARFGLHGPKMAFAWPRRAREVAIPSRPDNTASALRIWQESRDPRGTIVERYLRSRGLELFDDAANEATRIVHFAARERRRWFASCAISLRMRR